MRKPILVNYSDINEVFDDWLIPNELRPQITIITATTGWGDDSYDAQSVDLIYYLDDKLYKNMSMYPIKNTDFWTMSVEMTVESLLNYSALLDITKENVKQYFKSVIAFI